MSIDTTADKATLEAQIKNVVRTGYTDPAESNIDTSNSGTALVRQMSMKRALDKIKSTVGTV